MLNLISNAMAAKVIIGTSLVAAIGFLFPIYEESHKTVVELDAKVNAQQLRIARECAWAQGYRQEASPEKLVELNCLDAEYLARQPLPAPIPREAFDNLANQTQELAAQETQATEAGAI